MEALSRDLQRHLEGRPVLARPQSLGYRLQKYLLRQRWTLAIGGLATTLLVAALAASLWQGRQAMREAATDTAAALGFISAIGAIGGFFIPKAFGTSLAMTGSPVGAMKVFFVFYVVCVLVTWLVYGRRKPTATRQ